MQVYVSFFAGLHERLQLPAGQELIQNLQAGALIATLLQQLGLEPREPLLILVNGRHSRPESQLHPGDRIALFPPVAGG